MSLLTASGADQEVPLAAELAAPLLPRVDLLPPELAQERVLRRVKTGVAGALLSTVAVAALLHVAAGGSVQDAQADLDAAAAVGSGLRAEQAQYDPVVETRRRARTAEQVLADAMGQEVRFSGLLDVLSRSTPDGVWLRAATLTQTSGAAPVPGAGAGAPGDVPSPAPADALGTATFTVVGLDHAQVAGWLESLEATAGFRDVRFSTAKQTRVGGRTVVEFASTATLTPEVLSGRYTTTTGAGS